MDWVDRQVGLARLGWVDCDKPIRLGWSRLGWSRLGWVDCGKPIRLGWSRLGWVDCGKPIRLGWARLGWVDCAKRTIFYANYIYIILIILLCSL